LDGCGSAYYPLSPAMLSGIVRLQLGRIVKRMRENHDIAFRYSDAVVELNRLPLQRGRIGRARYRRYPNQHHAAELSIDFSIARYGAGGQGDCGGGGRLEFSYRLNDAAKKWA